VRLLIIVNSFASSVTARNKVLIRQALRRDHDVAIVETNRRGHATRFAQDAAARGMDVVVALGGDGTLNEVANGLVGSATALAVLPGGSTNVFARTIALPNDPVPTAQMLGRALAAGSIAPVGLGRVNGRYFTFHTGIGFDAAVVASVERRASLKRWAGHPLFVWAALSTWLRGYDRRHPHFRLHLPDGSELADGYFTIVLNTSPYTYLGDRALDLSRAATLERPLVAITFRTMRATVILGTLARALRGGGVETGPLVDCRTDLSQLVVEHDTPFPYQVDGDHLGDTKRLQFRHVPAAVRLVLPASSA